MADPLIELRGVTKRYREGEGEHVVFRDLDLAVARGRITALVGPSGSGKSTLLNLVAGIDLPSAGAVVVDGVDLAALPERERTLFRRERIGVVFQFFNLLPLLTVEENLMLPLELLGRGGGTGRARAGSLLERVGLAGRRASFPDRLSGGEQQRLAIARALVHRPALVLADEPTGNLDADTAQAVLGLFQDLVSEAGATVLLVTHSRDVAALAHRVLEVVHGRVIERRAEA